MSIIARAELDVAAPLPQVFAHFIDFRKWREWMPEVFFPVSGPERALNAGDNFKVRIGKLPLSLKVVSFRPDAEFGWHGGLPLLIQGTHVFKFEAVGNKTKIRSEETLAGLIAMKFMAARVQADASAQAVILMERFASHLGRSYTPASVSAGQ